MPWLVWGSLDGEPRNEPLRVARVLSVQSMEVWIFQKCGCKISLEEEKRE